MLSVSAVAKRLELLLHFLDSPSEVGQLTSDGRYVLVDCHDPILRWDRLTLQPSAVYAGNGQTLSTPTDGAAVSQSDVACFQVSTH